MAGGFSSGPAVPGVGPRVKAENNAGNGGNGNVVELGADGNSKMQSSQELLRVQTLGGRVKIPEKGDPVYMLAAFRGSEYSFFFFIFCISSLFLSSC